MRHRNHRGSGKRAAAKECQAGFVDPAARPFQRFPGAVSEAIRVYLAAQRRIMVSHHHVIGVGVRGFEHLGRIRTVSDHVPEADHDVHAQAADIQEHGLPCLLVRVQIGYQCVSHARMQKRPAAGAWPVFSSARRHSAASLRFRSCLTSAKGVVYLRLAG